MDLYVSPVKGRYVARYGTATSKRVKGPVDKKTGKATWTVLSTNNTIIGGAKRIAATGPFSGRPFEENDPEVVEMIPSAEVARFKRHYERSIAEGSLTVRTKAAYEAYLEAQATETTTKALALKKAAAKAALAEKAKTDAAAAKQLAAEAEAEAEESAPDDVAASA